MRAVFLFIFLATTGPVLLSQDALFINEFMSSNGITIADEDGDFEDWIELYNAGDESIDLDGFYLSDQISNPLRWQFPAVSIPADGFLLIFASGKNRLGDELHTNFKISSDGEPLLLSNPDGELVDFVPAVLVGRDASYGRWPDGSVDRYLFDLPSPGGPNIRVFGSNVFFSEASGFYEASFDLEIWSDQPGVSIHYTLNGDLPDTTSPVYTDPLNLRPSDEMENNPIIFIPTNSRSTSHWYKWKDPGEDLFKGHAIRARAFLDGQPYSEVTTATFFIDPNYTDRFDLPVISIVTPEDGLFDHETGIFVPGKGFEDKPIFAGFWSGGNFHHRGREWERTAEFYFFEPKGEPGFHQQMGMRIHGGGSRSFPQKSLRLYARNSYGTSHIEYPVFEGDTLNKFKRLLLRNSGQDFIFSMMRDGLTHVLVRDFDLDYQRYRPAVLFINGAYWGIINIRDRLDKHHFELQKGVKEEDLDFLEFGGHEVIEGESNGYLNMMEYLRSNPMEEEEHYQVVSGLMDIENFIDYYIAKKFFGVYDWPGNNIKFWRDRSVNGKWKWIYYDNDDAFQDVYFNSYDHLTDSTDSGWPNPLWSTELFRNLMLNESFQSQFLNRVKHLLETAFHPNNSIPLALQTIENISSEIPHHIERWQYPNHRDQWLDNVNSIVDFLEDRPCVFWEMTLNFFDKDLENHPLEYCIPSGTIDLTSGVDIFPNPVKDNLNIHFEENQQIQNLQIFDAAGRVVSTPGLGNIDHSRRFQIPVSHLSPGVYLMRIETSSGSSFVEKIVVMR
jgi:hypothetical protein